MASRVYRSVSLSDLSDTKREVQRKTSYLNPKGKLQSFFISFNVNVTVI